MAEVTVQQTRKRIKIQQPFALLTFVLGLTLMIMGGQEADGPQKTAMMGNGGLTLFGGAVWLLGLRVAKWWFHD
jgi:hypothetical protein